MRMLSRRVNKPRQFASGRTAITVTDPDCLPIEALGKYTGRLYVFRRSTAGVWIDRKDAPTVLKSLTKAGISLDQMVGEIVEKRREQLAKKAKPAKEAKPATPSGGEK